MARKARRRISYVLPVATSPNGHRLGINGLAVDNEGSALYSGGRDGVIATWSLNSDRSKEDTRNGSPPSAARQTDLRTTWTAQVQAHTHWVNDVVLTADNSTLVSASSDLTVKAWRPSGDTTAQPETIGLHSDYVKCLASPKSSSDWVASGGLDGKICLWDLQGAGQKLQIDVGQEEETAKRSVYALSVHPGVIASGGPENIVRLWDPKSGKRITKFVGHTGNIRDVLINEDGDTIMTASSDQTVKVWSLSAGRCMYTLTMHNDSVWCLYSSHPQLSVFYSGDRSGLVAKTDTRGTTEMDEGLSVAICQEHEGVNKVVCAGGHLWTATSSSSINRWKDVETETELQSLNARRSRFSVSTARSNRQAMPPSPTSAVSVPSRPRLPPNSILRLSVTSPLLDRNADDPDSRTVYSSNSVRRPSEAFVDPDPGIVEPIYDLPQESIEGHNGLIKHVMLNDRRRVLTMDTAGDVVLWDLLQCSPVQSFGKQHLEDVVPQVNTTDTVTNWCTVDTRTGTLACILEENHCFDAELYADELDIKEAVEFRDDQRINLGKWVLRYLFSNLIDEEIKRDTEHRRTLELNTPSTETGGIQRTNAPPAIQLPSSDTNGNGHHATTTPRAVNGTHHHRHTPITPSFSIGFATPALGHPGHHAPTTTEHLPPTFEEGAEMSKKPSNTSQPRLSTDKTSDYFSAGGGHTPPPGQESKNGGGEEDQQRQPSADGEKEPAAGGKEGSRIFGKFKASFSAKKLGRSSSMDTSKPTIVDEKAEDSDGSKAGDGGDQPIEENLFGAVQKVRYGYDAQLKAEPDKPILTGIAPSLPSETPVLKPPPATAIIIQEDRPDTGGVADLYRGTVASAGLDADLIEKSAPLWLGDLLLRNEIPMKEAPKLSFMLQPWQDLLPSIANTDGNARLNANRMIRAKKILAYVAERIDPPLRPSEEPDPEAMKPEEYLELYCQGQLVPPNITLAHLRVNIWKSGGDLVLFYKSNGKKKNLGEKSTASGDAEEAKEGRVEGSNSASASASASAPESSAASASLS